MIPKIIHYCWFGNGEMPDRDKKCIESWYKFCPDYEIKLWNESNYNVHSNRFMAEAYDAKMWGFVPDYARLDIVYKHGGIYLDTDVEIIRPLDQLLDYSGFAGIEHGDHIALGLGFGAEKHHKVISANLELYDKLSLYDEQGKEKLIASPLLSTNVFEELGYVKEDKLQDIDGFMILPTDYLCPLNFQTGELSIGMNTYSIHWYNASWFTDKQRKEYRIRQELTRKYGKTGEKLFKLYKYINPIRLIKRLAYGDDVDYR